MTGTNASAILTLKSAGIFLAFSVLAIISTHYGPIILSW